MLKELFDGIVNLKGTLDKANAEVSVKDLGAAKLPYIHHGDKLTKLENPGFPTLCVATLAGLVEAVKASLTPKPHAICINSPTSVSAISKEDGPWLQRGSLVKASFVPMAYSYGTWQTIEDFLVMLRARFGATEDREKLVKTLGNIQGGSLKTAIDDGFSQKVNVHVGVSLLGEEKIANPVQLKPYRTFHDIDQPASAFVVRLKQDNNQTVHAMIVEADGGLWQRTAMDGIYKFLADAKLGITILG